MNGVRQFFRPRWLLAHLLVTLAVATCLRLAWWQLDRSEEADGTLQNVGYALLWPAFGATFIWMWVRFIRLEGERSDVDEGEHQQSLAELLAEAEALTKSAAPSGGRVDPTSDAGTMDTAEAVTGDAPGDPGIPGSTAPAAVDDHDHIPLESGDLDDEDEDDADLTAYNRALAALAEEDHRAR